MIKRINIKPLSQNEAYKGRKFKTKKYHVFEKGMMLLLPTIKVPKGKLQINYKFGFSTSASDIDNSIKSTQDLLSRKYKFNDNLIYRIEVEKEIVKKGSEFIEFEIIEHKKLL